MTRFKTAAALAASLFLAFTIGAQAGDALSVSELQKLAPGRYAVTLYNSVNMTITMKPNGTVVGTSKTERDSGTWKLSGNQLCISWRKWLGGQARCSGLVSDGGQYHGNGFTFKRI
jgi:hypothetical protein